MSRADSKHKPSRQIFKGIHHQDTKAAEIRKFLPNSAVPEPWEGKERERYRRKSFPAGAAGTALASYHSSFPGSGTARLQLLFLRVGGALGVLTSESWRGC